MGLPSNFVAFDWTGAQQSKQDRKLQPGELVELVNTRRTEEGPGPLRKRLGLDRTSIDTFFDRQSGVSYVGPATHFECSDSEVWRDTNENLWTRDPDTGFGWYLGTDPRCFYRPFNIENLATLGRAHKPHAVLTSGNIWYFDIAVMASDGTEYVGYQLTIVDATTKIVKRSELITFSFPVSIDGYTVVVDGSGNVWFLWFDNGATGVIRAHKYTAFTATATLTTFATVTGVDITMIDSWRNTTSGDVDVVAIGTTSGTPNVITNYHAVLNTSTGAAKVSPAAVTETQNGSTNASVTACASGLSILDHDGADGFFYYGFFREKSAATDSIEFVRVKVTQSDLTVSSKTVVKDFTLTTTGTLSLGTSTGYVSGSTEVYFTTHMEATPSTWATEIPERSCRIERHTYTGTVANANLQLSAYVAGKIFSVGTKRYLLAGFDDGEATRAQRGYMLIDTNGDVLTTVADGSGAAVFHAGGLVRAYDTTTNPYLYRNTSPHVVPVLSIGSSKYVYPLLNEGVGVASPDPFMAELDFAAVFHSQAPGIVVGGVPKFTGPQDRVGELSPMRFPYMPLTFATYAGGSVASETRMTVRYVTRNAKGELHRSAPMSTQLVSFTGATVYLLTVTPLHHTNGLAWIEIYGSVPGGTDMFLQMTVHNSTTQASTQVLVQPGAFTATGELLDTVGGALEPAPLPPCRLAIVHKSRTWLGGTPDGEIWPSLEHRQGRGPEFNEALNFEWKRGTGELRAWASVDDNTLALFKEDAIALVTGNGPDGVGNGSFDVTTLAGKDGCSSPYACVQGPLGVYFQRHADGRMCLLTAAGVQEIHQGMEDYVSYSFAGAVDVKSKRELRFYATNGKVLVLDYGHPTPDQPWGQWVLHENSNLPAWIGARLLSGEPVALEAGTTSIARTWKPGTGFTDNGTEIAKRWKTGKMSPAGFLGEFDTDLVQMSSTVLGGASAYTYTLIDDQGNTEAHADASNATADVVFRSGRYRTRDVQLQVVETTPSGEGRQFDGVTMEFLPYGRPQDPRRRIT
jgi:hypothetical protein